jgi:hypothetical protein
LKQKGKWLQWTCVNKGCQARLKTTCDLGHYRDHKKTHTCVQPHVDDLTSEELTDQILDNVLLGPSTQFDSLLKTKAINKANKQAKRGQSYNYLIPHGGNGNSAAVAQP